MKTLYFNLNERSDTPWMFDVDVEVIYNKERHSIRFVTIGHLGSERMYSEEILLPPDVYIDDQIVGIIRRLTAHFCFTRSDKQPDIIMICHKDARTRKTISALLPYMIYKIKVHNSLDTINYGKVRYMVVPSHAEIEYIGTKAQLNKWLQTEWLKIKSIISAKLSRIPIIPIQRYYRDFERKNK